MVSAKSLLDQARASEYWRDRWVIALVGFAFVLIVAGYAHVASRFPTLQGVIPLHFNSMGEVDYLGMPIEAFKIPSIGLAIWGVNLVLSLVIYNREPLASRLLMGTSVAASAILLAAVVIIVT